MHRVSTLFFDSPIHFPLHEQSNWYTSGWLFGSSFSLFFWQRICCRFFPEMKAISFPFSLTHVLLLDCCLESKVISLDLHSLDFVCCFRGCLYYSFYCCILSLSFSKVVSLWPFSSNISIKNISLIYFSEHMKCALWKKPLNTLLMLGSMHVSLICMLVMAFLRCTLLKSAVVVNGVSNINIQEI